MNEIPPPPAAGPARPPVPINLALRRFGWLSAFLLVLGGFLMLTGARVEPAWTGDGWWEASAGVDSNWGFSAASYSGVSWFEAFQQHQFVVGVAFAVVGAVGLLMVLAFMSWRHERGGPRAAQAPTPAVLTGSNPYLRTLAVLAAALFVCGLALLVAGIAHEAGDVPPTVAPPGAGWADVLLPRFFTIGLTGVCLGLLALLTLLAVTAWRTDVRAGLRQALP